MGETDKDLIMGEGTSKGTISLLGRGGSDHGQTQMVAEIKLNGGSSGSSEEGRLKKYR